MRTPATAARYPGRGAAQPVLTRKLMDRSGKRRGKTDQRQSAPPGEGVTASDALRSDAIVSSSGQATTAPTDAPADTARQDRVAPREETGTGQPPAAMALRVVIEHVEPQVDEGRFPTKRTVGDTVDVLASIFADGHDVIVAVLRHRRGTSRWRNLQSPGARRRCARRRRAPTGGRPVRPWTLSAGTSIAIVAWVDPFRDVAPRLRLKANAQQDVALELLEGAHARP